MFNGLIFLGVATRSKCPDGVLLKQGSMHMSFSQLNVALQHNAASTYTGHAQGELNSNVVTKDRGCACSCWLHSVKVMEEGSAQLRGHQDHELFFIRCFEPEPCAPHRQCPTVEHP